MTDASFVNTHGTATFRVLKRGPGNTVPQFKPAKVAMAVFPVPDSTVPASSPAVPIVQYGGYETWKPMKVPVLIVATNGLAALEGLRDPSDGGTLLNYPGKIGSGTQTITGVRFIDFDGDPDWHIGESTETTDRVELLFWKSP